MKRRYEIEKLSNEAKRRNLPFSVVELTNHTSIKVGDTWSTLGRHAEINDLTARKFWSQFAQELGKGWWR